MTIASLLFVDDDQAEVTLLTRLACDVFPGARVQTAFNAQAAWDACQDEHYDCIILDYNMPGTDGLTCAQRLRSAFPYLPMVMSTSCGDEMFAARAVMNGVTDYIPKSRMTAQALKRVVENAVRIVAQARVIDEQRGELENFAYALSHDFKQPIRQIKTFSKLLSEAVNAANAEAVDQHLEFLSTAVHRLGNLVDAMSDYALLSQEPEISAVDLNAVFCGVRTLIQPYVDERRGQISFDGAYKVQGNEALMTQVLQNLVVNGLKYNKSSNPAVHVSCEAASGRCLVRVKDNGIGIEPQYRDDIFKPLVRLHTNREYPGTGLGLTLAKKALASMGGSISCRSEAGRGAEFVVDIGLATA